MEPESTTPEKAKPARRVSIRLLRILIFAQLTVLVATGVMVIRRAATSAQRLDVDVTYVQGIGWIYVALVAGGLALVLRTYWRPERRSWHLLSRYFWITGAVMLIAGLSLRFFASGTMAGGAVRVLPGVLFMVAHVCIGEWAGRGVKQRIWEQR